MTWQDWVIGIGQFGFALSLIPSLFSGAKPHLWTSVMTAVVLCAFALVYVTLGMYLGAGSVTLCAVGWAILAWQEWRRRWRPL